MTKAEYKHQWYLAHRDECRARAAKFVLDNPDHVRAVRARYEESHKKSLSAYRNRYRKEHKGKIAAKDKAWREANKEAIAVRRKARYAERREELCSQKRERYANDSGYRGRLLAGQRVPVHEKKRRAKQSPEQRLACRRAHYRTNREAILAAGAKYRSEHREEIRTKQRAAIRKNPEANRKRVREWQKSNPERVRKAQLAGYYRNKEKWLARNAKWQKVSKRRKQWKEENREKMNADARRRYHSDSSRLEYLRQWGLQNRDKRTQYSRTYMANNPEARMRAVAWHRIRRVGAWKEIVGKWTRIGELCYICGVHVDKYEISIDHVLARCHGGTHELSNLMPTHSKCNSRKNNRKNWPFARPDLLELQ